MRRQPFANQEERPSWQAALWASGIRLAASRTVRNLFLLLKLSSSLLSALASGGRHVPIASV